MNDTLTQLTLRRWATICSDPRTYVFIFLSIVALTVISPLGFATDQDFYGRLNLAITGNGICWTIGLLVNPPIRILIEDVGIRRPYSVMLSCTLTALIICPIMLWVLVNEFSHQPTPIRTFELLIFVVLVAFFYTHYLLQSAETRKQAADQSSPSKPQVPPSRELTGIQGRLPVHKRGVIQAMVAQDHYVQVITNKGNTLILMRLSDAIDLCEATDSLRIHRSVWVSRDGIKEVKKIGRKTVVRLPDGRELPVARSAETKLKKFIERETSGRFELA